jgi:tetratricopeptide (TPR) repeat protein
MTRTNVHLGSLAWFLAVALGLHAQSPPPANSATKRPAASAAPAVAPAVLQAETAIEKKDYALAERLLADHIARFPADHRAWYDLAFVFKVTDRASLAIDAYKKSLAAKPDVFDANLDLGELLLASGQPHDALPFLQAALRLKKDPHAYRLQAAALEDSDLEAALDSYRQALALQPKDIAVQIRIAALLERAQRPADAEAAYRAALALDPDSIPALTGLVDLYGSSGRFADAEAPLQALLRLLPSDPGLQLRLARLRLQTGKAAEAVAGLEAASAAHPEDLSLLRELSAARLAAKQFEAALSGFARLLAALPGDRDLRLGYARSLMHLMRYPEAEREFVAALKLEAKDPSALGDLAFCSHQNRHYEMAIQALDMRAQLTPDTPATLFLRATAYDHLRAYGPAAEFYRKFLEAAAGRFPDQEFQARHRLIAIEPKERR